MNRIGWLVLVVLTVAGCSHGSTAAQGRGKSTTSFSGTSSTEHQETRPARATAHLEVASRTVGAGAALKVVLVIENGTGKPIPQPQCNDPTQWQAFLANGVAASGPLPVADVARACDRMSLPTGETRLTFTINATYFSCAPAADSYPPKPKCLSGNRMPPLPVGQYRLDTTSSPYIGVPKAVPVNVRVVSAPG
ncbi:MAG: hypothetical protein QOE48_3984 [Mycobacterium sp.]|jgi:hypothetical protein|nr:hypothetical protein [Mycobacterium sp.]